MIQGQLAYPLEDLHLVVAVGEDAIQREEWTGRLSTSLHQSDNIDFTQNKEGKG